MNALLLSRISALPDPRRCTSAPALGSRHRASPIGGLSCAAAFAALALVASPLSAQRTQLDPDYTLQVLDHDSAIRSLALFPDPTDPARLYAVGAIAYFGREEANPFLRIDSAGNLDPTFSTDAVPPELIIPLRDGRLVIAQRIPAFEWPPDSQFLYRINHDGTRDASYPRIETTGFYAKSLPLADGRTILVGGWENARDVFGRDCALYRLTRLNADGTPDSGYAPSLPQNCTRILGAAAGADGSVVVLVGNAPPPGSPFVWPPDPGTPVALLRFGPDGAADPTFQPPSALTPLAVLADGSVLVSGAPLARLDPDGSLDSSFLPHIPGLAVVRAVRLLDNGSFVAEGAPAGGPASVNVTTIVGADGVERPEILDSIGGFRVAAEMADGSLLVGTSSWPPQAPGVQSRYQLVRIEPDGSNPRTVTPDVANEGSLGKIREDASGAMIIDGRFDEIEGRPLRRIARLLPDGVLDPDFAVAASLREPLLLLVHADGRILVTDYTGVEPRQVRRLLANGALDPAFPIGSPLATDGAKLFGFDAAGRVVGVTQDDHSTDQPTYSIVLYADDGSRALAVPIASGGLTPIRILGIEDVQVLEDGGFLVDANLLRDQWSVELLRLTADGLVDPRYHPEIPSGLEVKMVELQPGGRAVVLAGGYGPAGYRREVVRLLPDGSRDPAFFVAPADRDEFDLSEWLNRSQRSTVRLGHSSNYLRRWLADGSLDPNLEPTYVVLGPGGGEALQRADGSIYLCGFVPRDPRGTHIARLLPVESDGFTTQPQDATIAAGGPVVLQVALGTSAAATWQWQFNGEDIAGATGARLVLENARVEDSGFYRVVVRVGSTTCTSEVAELIVAGDAARLANFSARSRVGPGSGQVAGLVVRSARPHPVLFRAIGTALPFDLGTPLLPDPVLDFYAGPDHFDSDRGGVWRQEILELGGRLGAFAPSDANPGPHPPRTTNSALAPALVSGTYTAHVTSGDGASGVDLVEFYDAGDSSAGVCVRNLSIRARTGAGSDLLIVGFSVCGKGGLRLLLRAIGPSLAQFGVADPATDPRLILWRHSDTSAPFASNDDWAGNHEISDAIAAVHAFPIAYDTRDAAALVTLPPGCYSMHLPNRDDVPAEVLAEIYVLED